MTLPLGESPDVCGAFPALLPAPGTQGLVAVFVRSDELQHLLFGLGVRALVETVLGIELPLLVRGVGLGSGISDFCRIYYVLI